MFFSVIDMSISNAFKNLMCQHQETHLLHYCVDLIEIIAIKLFFFCSIVVPELPEEYGRGFHVPRNTWKT